MTVSKQCFVAVCFVLFEKVVVNTVLACNVDEQSSYYKSIEISWCTKTLCKTGYYGYYPADAQNIEIGHTDLIPFLAIQKAKHLRYIKGVNKNIKILASKSFSHLPVLEKIDLSFNLIRYIHDGVFINVSVTELDLSWNKILYIERKNFHGLRNLVKLDLSHNEIKTFNDNSRKPLLQNLNLSYNFLTTINIDSKVYPKLVVLDLSFNRIASFAITSEIPMRKIDLTNNFLWSLDSFDVSEVDELRLPLNKLSYISDETFDLSKIRQISLYPNMWNCFYLRNMWKELYKHSVTLLGSDHDYRLTALSESTAVCIALGIHENLGQLMKTFDESNVKFIKDNHTPCDEDHMCSDDELCRNRQCFNPCKENVCDSSSVCKAGNHSFSCDCPKNKKRDPMDLYSRCFMAECFQDDDCPYKSICASHLCKEIDR